MRVLATILLAGLVAGVALAQVETLRAQARPVLVDNFEQGIGRWVVNDDVAAGSGESEKCGIYAVSGGAPEGGRQSGRVQFERSASGWASVSVATDGKEWARRKCSRLALWVRGDGSGQAVRIVLRVQTKEPKRDEAYSQIIKLDSAEWESYGLRFFGFKDEAGSPLDPGDVQHIRLLQFAKNGAWPTIRFRVDEIAAEPEEGSAVEPPADPPADPPDGPPPIPPDKPKVKPVVLKPDFAKAGVPCLAQIGLNLGSVPTVLEGGTKEAKSWAAAAVSDLGPCAVRLQLADYFDGKKGTYNLKLLGEHVKWVRANQCRPLICVHMPPAPEADGAKKARLYGLFITAVADLAKARAQDGAATYYEIFDEPISSGAFGDVARVVAAYNKLAALIRATDPTAKIGGPGFSSPWDERVQAFVKGAERLDFLSFHFYGAHNMQTEGEGLFEAACVTKAGDVPHQMSFQEVRRASREGCDAPPEVFVTEFALNAARDERGRARDERWGSPFGAAWATAAVLCGTPYVDKVVLSRLYGAGFGLISDAGKPQDNYWAAWILKNYAPRGSQRLELFVVDPMTVAATFRTKSACNLIIAHAGADPVAFDLQPTGLPKLGQVRTRFVGGGEKGWTGAYLPVAEAQSLTMDGPGVLVVQWVGE